MSPINKHIHLSIEELKQYVYAENELNQIEIEHIELELQVCEKCSNIYVSLLEHMEFNFEPKQIDFEQLILKAEHEVNKVKVTAVKKKWYEHSLAHIAIAASITGLLFISGFLSVMTNMMNAEPSQSSTQEINNDVEEWFDFSKQEWFKQIQQTIQQFELFKEDK